MDTGVRNRFKIEISDAMHEMEHAQEDIEILYVMRGKLNLVVENEEVQMQENDIYVVNPNRRHSIHAAENVFYAKMFIDYNITTEIIGIVDVIFLCDSTKGENVAFDFMRTCMNKLLALHANHAGSLYNFNLFGLQYELLDCLVTNFMVRDTDFSAKREPDAAALRIQQINSYITSNYKAQISLKDLADKLYLSEAYLSRFIKKNFGVNFVKYVSNVRMQKAMEDLTQTNESITRIAYNNGFSNAAVFNKSFKQAYGETPSRFRRMHQQPQIVRKTDNEEVLTDRLVEYFRSGNIETDAPKNNDHVIEAHCNIGPLEDMKMYTPRIKGILNGGTANEMRNFELREHVTMLASSMKFEYVRFWNILSSKMYIGSDEEFGEFNFSRLDTLMDFILGLGLKPIIDLGAKPKTVMKNVRANIYTEDTLSSIKFDLKRWARLVDSVFRHFCESYGASVVGTWIVELWEDERQEQIPGYDYYQLFATTVKTLKRRVKNIKVAGSGIRADKDPAEITDHFRKWKANGTLPDYVTVMIYPYESGEEKGDFYTKRSTDDDSALHQIRKVKACMKQAGLPEETKIMVTEWNSTLSDRNVMNDTCYKGAYAIKTMLQTMDEVESMAYSRVSDRSGEYFDTNGLLFGGMGMISKDSILKPVGFAYEFMDRLLPHIVAKTDQYIVTMDENQNFCILIHNQRKLGYNYYLISEGDAKKEDIWKYYEDREKQSFHFEIGNVETGSKYKEKVYRVNEQYGSILAIWKDVGFDSSISRSDVKYFRKVCEPRLFINRINEQKGKLDFSVELEPNEITCIRLLKDN